MKYLLLIFLFSSLQAQEFFYIKSRVAAYKMFDELYTGKFKGENAKDYRDAMAKCHNSKVKAVMYITPEGDFFCGAKHGIKYFFDLTYKEIKPALNGAYWLQDGV